MISILIVDDEPDIVGVLMEYAKHNGMQVDIAFDGLSALKKVEETNFDCILLDIMMPRLDGYETAKAIKEIRSTPIIMVSAKTEEYDKLKGFELGIDDYITKPFSPREVMARVKAVLRRNASLGMARINDLIMINFSAHEVFVNGEPVKLTKKEYDLLLTLIKNKNIVLTRDKLINEVWGFEFEGDYRTIDTHIKMLRAHLLGAGDCIKTIRGLGYKFETN